MQKHCLWSHCLTGQRGNKSAKFSDAALLILNSEFHSLNCRGLQSRKNKKNKKLYRLQFVTVTIFQTFIEDDEINKINVIKELVEYIHAKLDMDMDMDETKISSDNKPLNPQEGDEMKTALEWEKKINSPFKISWSYKCQWWVKIQNWNNMSWWLVTDTGLGTNPRRKQKKKKKKLKMIWRQKAMELIKRKKIWNRCRSFTDHMIRLTNSGDLCLWPADSTYN